LQADKWLLDDQRNLDGTRLATALPPHLARANSNPDLDLKGQGCFCSPEAAVPLLAPIEIAPHDIYPLRVCSFYLNYWYLTGQS
jgi:hypothetical protein